MEQTGVMVTQATCLDHRGGIVGHGDRYFPLGSDPCTQCTCISGKPEMCISVFCSPPENCRQFHALSDKCCQFVCLDRHPPDRPLSGGNITSTDLETLSATNLGLRLVASTVTSFLILALLLFMIHRLRQRRLLLMIRRFHADNVDSGGPHQFPLDDEGSVGYFVGHDHLEFGRYSEPPPPYTLWKPPESYIPPGEAPPPYEASVGLAPPYIETHTNGQRDNSTRTDLRDQNSRFVHLQVPSYCNNMTFQLPPYPQNICEPSEVSGLRLNSEVVNSESTVNEMSSIRSDARYEDIPRFIPNVNSSCPQPCPTTASLSSTLGTCNESVISNPVVASETQICTSPSATTDTVVVASPNNSYLQQSNIKKLSNANKYQHKCHSYNEFMDHWHHHLLALKAAVNKRRSLQTPGQYQESYPQDPSTWTREGSESSSSSSPTYEPNPLSPSSSDSSTPEGEFSFNPQEMQRFGGAAASVALQRQHTLPSGESAPHITKSLSLDRNVTQLKKLSLSRKKKRKERKPEIQAENDLKIPTLSQNSSLPVPNDASDTPYRPGSSYNPSLYNSSIQSLEEASDCADRTTEAINLCVRHSHDKLDPKKAICPPVVYRKRFRMHPTFLSLPRTARPQFGSQEQTTPVHCTVQESVRDASAENSNHNDLPSNGVHCSASSSNGDSSGSHRVTVSISSRIEQLSNVQRRGIPRSGSICSETGERRYQCGVCSSEVSSPSQLSATEVSLNPSVSPSSTYSISCDTSPLAVPQQSNSAVCKQDSLHLDGKPMS